MHRALQPSTQGAVQPALSSLQALEVLLDERGCLEARAAVCAGCGAARVDADEEGGMRQTLQGSFSAVSKQNFASKYVFELGLKALAEIYTMHEPDVEV